MDAMLAFKAFSSKKGPYTWFVYNDEYFPKGNKPGKPLPKVGYVHRCGSGYHATPNGVDALSWVNRVYTMSGRRIARLRKGEQVFLVALSGTLDKSGYKVAASNMTILREVPQEVIAKALSLENKVPYDPYEINKVFRAWANRQRSLVAKYGKIA